jgi:glycosidase
MAERELEILIYDKDVRKLQPAIDYPGVTLKQVTRLENPNYLFLLLDIGPGTRPGKLPIILRDASGKPQRTISYELQAREQSATAVQGLHPGDLIYLIMPDRFANGDEGNDSVAGMNQQGTNRDKVFFRHGGDLIGVMEHLDYLEELGVTALWLNPVFENDQPYESYHGYAPTDLYQIDARLGTNANYRQLVQLAHERGIKVVMDVIFNHVGDQHWFIRDLPARDWIHQFPDSLPPVSYRAPVHMDPYGAAADFTAVSERWFDKHMPDLNQAHPQLANYLIQNSIWWTEYTGQDAFRIDTYAYCDQQFMARWNQRLLREFPTIGIFGETWVHGLGVQAWFTEGLRTGEHNSHLPGVTDYQLYYAMLEAINNETGWTSGTNRLYYTLAQDYLYQHPERNVIFLDNHDLGRIYNGVGEDLTKYKSAISLLLTLRGIPMIYYGTEILMTGEGGAFREGGRRDFPGGWSGDAVNAFKDKGRKGEMAEGFDFFRTLARYRKGSPALQQGQLTQFLPVEGVYVYFRHTPEQTILVAFNSNADQVEIPTDHFAEQMSEFTNARNVITDEKLPDVSRLLIKAKQTLILELE